MSQAPPPGQPTHGQPAPGRLAHETRGPAAPGGHPVERVALVHGFTQTRRCWGPLPDRLAATREVVLVDAPGHGGSSAVRADLVGSGRLLGATAGPATFVGYSMGGRMALHLALDRPDLVQRLVLVGATAGIEDAVERDRRRAADEALATHLEAVGVDRFLDEWLAQPLFASLAPAAACREERRTNTAAGLASSLRTAGTGTQEPLWDRLGSLAVPVLVVAGGDDAKFRALGARLVAGIGPAAELAVVDGAGHSAHLEQPEAFADLVETWLARP